MVEPSQPLDAFRYKFLDEVDLRDNLWIFESTDDVDDDTLEVVRVDEQLFRRYVVVFPELVDFLAHLLGATVVDPLEFTHWRGQDAQLLEVFNGERVGLAFVDVGNILILCSCIIEHLCFLVF